MKKLTKPDVCPICGSTDLRHEEVRKHLVGKRGRLVNALVKVCKTYQKVFLDSTKHTHEWSITRKGVP